MPHRPPRNVEEALRDWGIPEGYDKGMLEWLAAKHTDLATRNRRQTEHDLKRLRWAYTVTDILRTMQDPTVYSQLPRPSR